MSFIEASNLFKIHKVDTLEVVALKGVDLHIAQGEFLALVGPSGSGKSTLLSMLGGLDRPSAGSLRVNQLDLLACNPQQLSAYRRKDVGFVWQQTARNLLPYLSARQNVELLQMLARQHRERSWANELLTAVGLEQIAGRKLSELSGGQQQRAAIACALVNRPSILLGDEPTGELDWPTAQRILGLLQEIRAQYKLTIVLVTHDERVASQADRIISMSDGRISADYRPQGVTL